MKFRGNAQKDAEGSREQQREAEGSRGKQREAEGSRGKPDVRDHRLVDVDVAPLSAKPFRRKKERKKK